MKRVVNLKLFLQRLHELTPSDEDRESLEQVEGLLNPLKLELNQIVSTLPRK